MAQSLSFNLVHAVWSTKERRPWVSEEIGPRLYAYLAEMARGTGCECFRAGGMEDHVHLALRLGVTRTAAKVVSELKTGSSAWMKEEGVAGFAWQRGYGLFSVGPADIGALLRYIDGQRAHHQRRSYQEEMRAFLEKCHVPFDERYVWG